MDQDLAQPGGNELALQALNVRSFVDGDDLRARDHEFTRLAIGKLQSVAKDLHLGIHLLFARVVFGPFLDVVVQVDPSKGRFILAQTVVEEQAQQASSEVHHHAYDRIKEPVEEVSRERKHSTQPVGMHPKNALGQEFRQKENDHRGKQGLYEQEQTIGRDAAGDGFQQLGHIQPKYDQRDVVAHQ